MAKNIQHKSTRLASVLGEPPAMNIAGITGDLRRLRLDPRFRSPFRRKFVVDVRNPNAVTKPPPLADTLERMTLTEFRQWLPRLFGRKGGAS